MYSTIVVGSDGSPTATHAIVRAGQLAALCDAKVHLVFGCGSQVAVADPIGGAAVVVTDEYLAELEGMLEKQADAIRERGVEVDVHVITSSGPEAILGCAEKTGADLIVVGNRGMTRKTRFLLGSVPNAVSHHAPCSVLIVHTT